MRFEWIVKENAAPPPPPPPPSIIGFVRETWGKVLGIVTTSRLKPKPSIKNKPRTICLLLPLEKKLLLFKICTVMFVVVS